MIRRHFCFLFFVSIYLALAGVHVTQAEEEVENLVVNAGFEGRSMEPWWLWIEDWENVEAAMTIVNWESFTGSQSLIVEITKRGGGQRVELHQGGHGTPAFHLKKGQKLTYAFWAKAEEGISVSAIMCACHREPPWTMYCKKNITISDEWTDLWAPVDVFVDDDLVGIYVELRDNREISIWFDYFRLYEGDYILEFPRIAVEPRTKLAFTWAAIRSAR
jgi:hypothetical protein